VRRSKDRCRFIWAWSGGDAAFCGARGYAVHVKMNQTSLAMPVLPLADGQREGDFVLCLRHQGWLRRERAEVEELGSSHD